MRLVIQQTTPVIRRVTFQAALCCLLPVLCATVSLAPYRFDHWTADNGLPQNPVCDIVQTRDGYLWLATFDGLVRFDGVRFTVFNKNNSPGIVTNRFIRLFEDAQGDLWANTEGGALTRQQAYFNLKTLDAAGAEQGLLLKVQGATANYQQGAIRERYNAVSSQVLVETWQPGSTAWLAYAPLSVTFNSGDELRGVGDGERRSAYLSEL
jgi:ligand-binding sensor domain-containing protein